MIHRVGGGSGEGRSENFKPIDYFSVVKFPVFSFVFTIRTNLCKINQLSGLKFGG